MVLGSLANQSVLPEQIVVVDDMSDDLQAKQHIELSHNYGVDYLYFRREPKRYRLNQCYMIGLSVLNTEFVAFSNDDLVFDNDYVEKCLSILTNYKNMVMMNATHRLPYPVDVKKLEEVGYTLEEISKSHYESIDRYHPMMLTGEEPCWNTMDNIHTSPNNEGMDGIVLTRTNLARKYQLWDINWEGWGRNKHEMLCTARTNGLAPVVFKDIKAYHLLHEKVPMQIIGTADHEEYFEKKWGGKNIYLEFPLELVAGLKEPAFGDR